MDEAHKIAEGLSEAQRRLMRKKRLNHKQSLEVPMVGLVRRNMMQPWAWDWTPLGLQVRSLLASQESSR